MIWKSGMHCTLDKKFFCPFLHKRPHFLLPYILLFCPLKPARKWFYPKKKHELQREQTLLFKWTFSGDRDAPPPSPSPNVSRVREEPSDVYVYNTLFGPLRTAVWPSSASSSPFLGGEEWEVEFFQLSSRGQQKLWLDWGCSGWAKSSMGAYAMRF